MAEPRKGMDDRASLIRARLWITRQARRARLVILTERIARAFWPVVALAFVFAGVVLLGLPALTTPDVHIGIFAAFLAGATFFTVRGISGLRAPSLTDGKARLDRGAEGRPAQTLNDNLVAGSRDDGSKQLWAAHQARLAEKAAKLKPGLPDPRLENRDPFAFRIAAMLVFAAGLVGYFGASAVSLKDQFIPTVDVKTASGPVTTVEAWASPPVYTGVTPVYLSRLETGDVAVVPEGSEVSVRVFDASLPPKLTETVSGESFEFSDQGAGVYEAAFTLSQSGSVEISVGEVTVQRWSLTMTPDAPPTIAFLSEPEADGRGTTSFRFEATDDYGVRFADGLIRLDNAGEPPLKGVTAATVFEALELELPLPLTGDNTLTAEQFQEDLASHPFAGLPVIITLTAHDAAGQTGSTELRVKMPERRFTHPMARALVEQRRWLIWSPDATPHVLDVAEAVMKYPEQVFNDTSAFLAARMAVRRLGYALEDDRVVEETPSVVDLFWKAAIRLEDGDLSSAAARLAQAQERLRQAIEEGASDEEIAELMDDLREAMRDYLAEMARENMRDQAENGGQQQQQQQQGQQGETLTQEDLERMMDEIEEAMRNGQQDLAREMLQALQQMMNNLQMAQPGQGQPGEGEQTMNQMGDMIGEQQGLADRSFNEMQRGQNQPGQQEGGGTQQGLEGQQNGAQGDDPGQIARDQEALRSLLDQLRGDLPGVASEDTQKSLDDAARAMDDALESLREGDTRRAVDDQVRALDALREGRRGMAQDMAEAQGNSQGERAGQEGANSSDRVDDPLGRPGQTADNPDDGRGVAVPGAHLGKRARDLQKEIRRRSEERERSAEELDYLDRLLERF
ncbi:MAG: TIGR02302 family protein [Pikeienuella sp.]